METQSLKMQIPWWVNQRLCFLSTFAKLLRSLRSHHQTLRRADLAGPEQLNQCQVPRGSRTSAEWARSRVRIQINRRKASSAARTAPYVKGRRRSAFTSQIK